MADNNPKAADVTDDSVRKVFVDGIQSIANHNGVFRIVFFNLVGDGKKNAAVLELQIPGSSARQIGEAMGRLGR